MLRIQVYWAWHVLDDPTLENEILRSILNTRNHVPSDKSTHPRRNESSNETHKLILQVITSLNYECLLDNSFTVSVTNTQIHIRPPAVPFRFPEKWEYKFTKVPSSYLNLYRPAVTESNHQYFMLKERRGILFSLLTHFKMCCHQPNLHSKRVWDKTSSHQNVANIRWTPTQIPTNTRIRLSHPPHNLQFLRK